MSLIVQPAGCPHCGARGKARMMLCVGNLLKASLIPFWYAFFLGLSIVVSIEVFPAFPLEWWWRCRACGNSFDAPSDYREPPRPQPTHAVCRRCEYDLTGTSGVCPECGWRVSDQS